MKLNSDKLIGYGSRVASNKDSGHRDYIPRREPKKQDRQSTNRRSYYNERITTPVERVDMAEVVRAIDRNTAMVLRVCDILNIIAENMQSQNDFTESIIMNLISDDDMIHDDGFVDETGEFFMNEPDMDGDIDDNNDGDYIPVVNESSIEGAPTENAGS